MASVIHMSIGGMPRLVTKSTKVPHHHIERSIVQRFVGFDHDEYVEVDCSCGHKWYRMVDVVAH